MDSRMAKEEGLEIQKLQEAAVSFEAAENLLVCRLLSKEKNRDALDRGPLKRHPMGAVLLFLEADGPGEKKVDLQVTHQMAQRWGQTEKALFDRAFQNTWEKNQPKFRGLWGIIHGIEQEEPGQKDSVSSYVLTNQSRQYGATMILYPDILKDIREKLGDDFYVLPSSVHELLIKPKTAEERSVKELERMVWEVNREVVGKRDFLSDHIYEYRAQEDVLKKVRTGRAEPIR